MRINDLEIKAAGPTIWLHWHQMGVPIPTTIQMTREEAEHVAMSLLMAARGLDDPHPARTKAIRTEP